MTNTQFCCSQMEYAINDHDVPVVYESKFREHGVRILDGGTSKLDFVFCPWCGQKLPDSLRRAWFDELERLGKDPYGGDIPQEFCDERWYASREGS